MSFNASSDNMSRPSTPGGVYPIPMPPNSMPQSASASQQPPPYPPAADKPRKAKKPKAPNVSASTSTTAAANDKHIVSVESLHEAEPIGCCGTCLTILSTMIIVLTFPLSLIWCIKIVKQYKRAVIFRLGQIRAGGAKGPGLFFVNPCIDTYRKVDMRTVAFDVPPQEILSKDSVTLVVDAVVYFRVFNATVAITNVQNATASTKLLSQTTLRNILGTKTLADMLSKRDEISHQMQKILDEATDNWGIKVERVEMKNMQLPQQMQRAMAAEAEAAREARAKVIAAEGEQKASMALRDAAQTIADSPTALQLRYLQTLQTISAERNSTIVFPFPVDLISFLTDRGRGGGGGGGRQHFHPLHQQQQQQDGSERVPESVMLGPPRPGGSVRLG